MSPEQILHASKIDVKKLSDGQKALTSYSQPDIDYTFKNLGVDENQLIDGVSTILGTLNLQRTSLELTRDIKTGHGDLSLSVNTNLKDISSLKKIYGTVFVHAKTKEEAFATLKKLHFSPEKYTGKIIILPEEI